MPTATSASQFTITNLGPLTTTFSAPASCVTDSNGILLGLSTSPAIVQWNTDCNNHTPFADCIPSASQINSYFSVMSDSPLVGYYIAYHSPGIYCPDAWTTAGVAVKDAGGAVSSNGAFNATVTFSPSFPTHNLAPNVFIAVLDPGEKAILCCPSAYTAGQDGGCFSVVSDYKVTSGCAREGSEDVYSDVTATFSIGGSLVTADIFTVTNTAKNTITEFVTLEPTDMSSYVGVKFLPMVTLVQRAGDVASPGASTSTAAGVSSRPVQGSWKSVVGVMVVCGVGAIFGAALMVPF